eukprot:GSChrysophyteH1.ASY1.ANO1.3262.1 assembled CDS
MKETNIHAKRHHILLRFLVVLGALYAVTADFAAGYTGGWDNLPSLISLVDARDAANSGITPTTTDGIPDLSGTAGMTWKLKSGSTSFISEDDIPCWDLNGGSLVTSTRTTLGDSYTLFYYWKPRESDTANPNSEGDSFRGMQLGLDLSGNPHSYWVIVGPNDKNLGMFSYDFSYDNSMRTSGYDITTEWQTLIVTGVAESAGSSVGTSTFYVNGVQVGTADRVGSGSQTYTIGHSNGKPAPGYLSVAGVLNQKLTTAEIKELHNRLAGTTSVSSCTPCPTGKYSAAGNGQVCGCAAGSTGSWNGFASLISLIDARDAANANIDPTSDPIPDLSGTPGMEWTESWGSTSFETVDTIPCWDLNAGGLVTSTRTTLGDSYTVFYYWKPRVSDTQFRVLNMGWDPVDNKAQDHVALVKQISKNLGMWSHRDGSGMRASGYDITIEWQTLIVTGVAESAGSHLGTSTFYVNGLLVGTAARVGSGTQTYTIGHPTTYPPGYISVAGVLNQKLTPAEIVTLHNRLAGTSSVSSCTTCPSDAYSDPGVGQVCDQCGAGYSRSSTANLPSLMTLIDAGHVDNADISPTTTVGIPDLSGTNGMEWTVYADTTVSFATDDGIRCWDMDAGYLITPFRKTLGDEYTLFYYWKPRATGTWNALHRGYDQSSAALGDDWVMIYTGGTELGFYTFRSGNSFSGAGHYISIGTWQTLVVTGVADSAGSSTGISTFYVNGENVGSVGRVGSGTQTWGLGSYMPGHVAVAGVLNQKLTTAEIKELHNQMVRTNSASTCSACPTGKYSSSGVGQTCNQCAAGYTGSWESLPSLLTLIDAGHPDNANIDPTTSVGIPDLSGTNGMKWTVVSGETVTYTTEDGIPCWDMDSGTLETTTRSTLGDEYTLFYYWKPRDTGNANSLHYGFNPTGSPNDAGDHWFSIYPSNNNLGYYSHRQNAFYDSGYDITLDTWQTLIITGVADSAGSSTGTSTFYVNGIQVGSTVDRVASGMQTRFIGYYNPGHVAIAGVLNQKLTTSEITALHNKMVNTNSASGCTACPVGKFSVTGSGKICESCDTGYSTSTTGSSSCDVCSAGYSGWSNLPSLISLIDARDAANAGVTPTGTVGITDLSGTNGMTWTKSWGSTSFTTEEGIPCWNLNNGGLTTSTRT